jgi:Protein of unknown function (DUF2442)
MFLHTTKIKPLPDYKLEVSFNTGEGGIVSLKDHLWGEMFEALKLPEMFATAFQDPVMRTVAWRNGADLAPEYLKSLLLSQNK